MNKVYIVTAARDYEGEDVMSVHSTRKGAEAAKAIIEAAGEYDNYDIAEKDLHE
jgi:hypothetical protein